MALTDTGIRALKPRKARYVVTDGRGLCLEVLPSGKLSWLYRYRVNGKPEKVTIGRYPDLGLKAVRNERDTMAGLVSRGQSPAREKQLAKLALATNSTMREFAERYYREVGYAVARTFEISAAILIMKSYRRSARRYFAR